MSEPEISSPTGVDWMNERERRIGLNEAVFREVNESLESVNETFATITRTFEIVCECADRSCIERIAIRPEAYEAIRSDPRLFVIVPTHEAPDREEVVRSGDGYEVVRKAEGAPATVAEQTDPR